ncbi:MULTISPECIES: PepSY domain-containing protein [Microbulbifer]|uniref:PepSY domain-containing protein n=1 Tax=Microbulbifer TaxID=48073 RepID=UPI001CD4EB95|nr:PepSY domain-containing protein [Microbulbifer agarilyticus]MCA0900094.1 PepSY domain-containing protein [Microbulbifer agarilyticus]
MKATLLKLHKWLSLLVGLQLAIWLVSGLGFSLLDGQIVSGRHLAEHQPQQSLQQPVAAYGQAALLQKYTRGSVLDLQLRRLHGRDLYRVQTLAGVELRDATSGALVDVDAAMALAVARRDYAGADALLGTPEYLPAAGLEARKHRGPIWRVPVADTFNTTLYVSAEDGRVLERRNDYWRLFDVLWMLHIMDYSERQDFNNPLLIGVGFATLWLVLSGVWLLFYRVSRRDFRWLALARRSRPRSGHARQA